MFGGDLLLFQLGGPKIVLSAVSYIRRPIRLGGSFVHIEERQAQRQHAVELSFLPAPEILEEIFADKQGPEVLNWVLEERAKRHRAHEPLSGERWVFARGTGLGSPGDR